jgi:hypothetical protein
MQGTKDRPLTPPARTKHPARPATLGKGTALPISIFCAAREIPNRQFARLENVLNLQKRKARRDF